MGRIEAQADLRDDLSPKIAQTAQNVDSAVGKMKGDFADLERSTTASFGEMVGAFGTGQIAADLFRQGVQAVRRFVDEASDAYVQHNRTLREAGEAYDEIVDKMDEQDRIHSKFMQNIGEQASGWKMLISDIRSAIEEMTTYLMLQGKIPKALTPGTGVGQDSTGFVTGNNSTSNTFFDRSGNPMIVPKTTAPFADPQTQAATEAKYANEIERAAKAAEREAVAAERAEAARLRSYNRATMIGINSQLRGFNRRGQFGEDEIDPTDPYGSNKSSFSSPSDGSRDGEFGAFNPISDQYMKALKASQDKAVDDAKKWGNLWSGTINSTLEAVLFDTHNFGKDFANIIKKALMQALVGDISASAGGPIGKILGGILGIKDARTGFETQVAPEMARASARGKL